MRRQSKLIKELLIRQKKFNRSDYYKTHYILN